MRYILILFLLPIIFYSCKKKAVREEVPEADMAYTLENSSVVLSDTSPLVADVNNDGTPDYTFYVVNTTNAQGDHLHLVTNALNGSSAITNPPENTLYSNSGWVISHPTGAVISASTKQNEIWNTDFGVFAIRHTTGSGTMYQGAWSDETEQIMGLRLAFNGKSYYGWGRVKYTRSQNKLTLVDYAYNRIPGMGTFAGQK